MQLCINAKRRCPLETRFFSFPWEFVRQSYFHFQVVRWFGSTVWEVSTVSKSRDARQPTIQVPGRPGTSSLFRIKLESIKFLANVLIKKQFLVKLINE